MNENAAVIAETLGNPLSDLKNGYFSSYLRAMVIGLSSLTMCAGAAGISGCSPQQTSYWNGTYTKLPAPPENSRMQVGVSTEQDGTLFINYVIWDKETNKFMRRDVHYTTTNLHPGTFSEAGGYEQAILDGEVLGSGAVVDQTNGQIILPGGLLLDGPTGSVTNSAGKIVKALSR